MSDFPNSSARYLVPVVVVLVIAFAVFSSMTVIVQSGNVGVIASLGAVQPNALPEGFHFKKPFIDHVQQVDIRLTASHAQATAASKDLQLVTTQVTMQYSLNGALAPQIYQRIGLLAKVSASLVEPAIQECVKAVTAKFTAEEPPTNNPSFSIK